MIAVYWILGILGALYMLSSLMGLDVDADLDVDSGDASDMDIDDSDDSPKVFSFRLLFGAFLGFGIGGGISYYNGWNLSWQIFLGALSAALFAFLAFQFAKLLHNMQGNSEITTDSVIGKPGVITIQTGNTGTAMAKVPTSNGPREFICFPSDRRVKFKVGDPIVVLSNEGGQLTVTRRVENQ